jgi:hypothetical protein
MERTDPKPFDTGLYHLSVVTGLSTGDRIRNWNLEIVPSRPPPPPGAPLVWMRIWIPIAGDVNHLADEPIVSDRDLGPNNGDGTCGGSAHIGPGDTVVGLVEPGEIRVVRVRLTPLGGASPADVPVRYAPNAATGLTVIALPSGGLATGSYRMTVDTSAAAGTDGRRVYTMCVT